MCRSAQGRRHDLVSPHVELLDLIACEIGAARIAELIPQRGVGQLLGDDGSYDTDAADNRGHAAPAPWEPSRACCSARCSSKRHL